MTTDSAFSAFSRVQFHSVFDLQQVWMDRPSGHLPLHENALKRFRHTLQQARELTERNPLGLCFVGPAGAGKTHLLGEIRREAAQQGANFVLSDLTDVRDFWPLLAMHYLQSLQKKMNGVRQLDRLLEFLLRQADDEPSDGNVLPEIRSLPREGIVSFANDVLSYLRPVYGEDLRRRHRVFRALLYLEADDFDLSERAYSFLQGVEQIDEESQKLLLAGTNSPKNVCIDLAWFLSLTGPAVLAFDQLDPFVAQNNLAAHPGGSESVKLMESLQVLFGVANGFFSIHEEFARTLIVVACLESSWKVLLDRAVASFKDRFEAIETLQTMRDPAAPSELVGLRLDEGYRRSGFTPPYRTWPYAASFFTSLPPGLTPREILNRAETHRLDCVRAGSVTELRSYTEAKPVETVIDLSHLDARLASELALVDAGALLDEAKEDALGNLVAQAARLFCRELPADPNVDLTVEDHFHETKQYQSLHLRLRRIYRVEGDREEHVCVRILQKSHYRSFQVRLTAALTTSGMSEKLDGRRLFLLRNTPPPSGVKTAEMLKNAKEFGADFLAIDEADVRTLGAVVEMSKSGDPMFETWLLRTLLLSKTTLFRQLAPAWIVKNGFSNGSVAAPPKPVPAAPVPTAPRKPAPQPAAALRPAETNVLLGWRLEAGAIGEPVYLPLADLTRHVMLRAGSGGGKTVFVKRLIEECALAGIPSIVIDTAKDLSMLGDRWNTPPNNWTPADAERAEQYHRNIDVRIWTPGHAGGRPLRLAPLPNLSGPFAEPHDRELVIDVAAAGLLPLAVQKKNPTVERAILRKVLEWLTRQPQHSGNELERLVAALRDLPGEAFQGYQNERKLAAGMADQIQAALVADPLYSGRGEDLDPAVLFGIGEARTRVSILSLFATPDAGTQARFIGQFANVLFNWIRRNPAPANMPVRGLLVLDEAARFLPRNNAESKPGLMLLAQQARKYGLGLVLATQNPKDLDYNATANFATQIFGTANVPQVVKYIQEAMEQRGLTGLNPGQLKPGQFFLATPSLDRPVRLQAPMCLSAHPNSVQLSDDEILARALTR